MALEGLAVHLTFMSVRREELLKCVNQNNDPTEGKA